MTTLEASRTETTPRKKYFGLPIDGLLIVFVGLPLAVAWLLGLLIGMLCRLGRSARQGAQQP